MTQLPITRMTLYKHGVGFFERRATLSGEEVELSFRVTEMNDILKSLTAIDWGGGQVLGVDYATPQSREERLAGCSIRLDDDRSLRDLLACLRGRRVELVPPVREEIAPALAERLLDLLDSRLPRMRSGGIGALAAALRGVGVEAALGGGDQRRGVGDGLDLLHSLQRRQRRRQYRQAPHRSLYPPRRS